LSELNKTVSNSSIDNNENIRNTIIDNNEIDFNNNCINMKESVECYQAIDYCHLLYVSDIHLNGIKEYYCNLNKPISQRFTNTTTTANNNNNNKFQTS